MSDTEPTVDTKVENVEVVEPTVEPESKADMKKRVYAEKKAIALQKKEELLKMKEKEEAEEKYNKICELRKRSAITKKKDAEVLKKKGILFDKYLANELSYEEIIQAGFKVKQKKEPKAPQKVEVIVKQQQHQEAPKKLSARELYDMLNN